ncbi:MAG: hypothetical protein J5565_01545 [Muribaculaceae bacterium]|nr:hypothetical protein [Muribaculaceae bacterium]
MKQATFLTLKDNLPVFPDTASWVKTHPKTDKLISPNSIINGFILLVVKKMFNFAPFMDVNAQNSCFSTKKLA